MVDASLDGTSLNNVQPFIEKVLNETGFLMVNSDKVVRAIYGMERGQDRIGGVGEEASSAVILAKYDEYNGFITKNGYKVKNRAFFHPKTKQPIEKPKIVFLIRVNDKMREWEEGTAESPEIQIAKRDVQEDQVRRGRGRPRKDVEPEEPKPEEPKNEQTA